MNASLFARSATRRAAFALVLLAAAAPLAAAPVAGRRAAGSAVDPDNPFTATDRAAAPELKTPCHLWGAPAEDDPAAQLARAKAFEARGRRSAARKAYDALVHNWGASPEAGEAQLGVARMREAEGDLPEAFQEYQYYLERYASSNPAPGCGYRDVVTAQWSIAAALLPKVGRGPFSESAERVASMFRHVAASAPDWERAPEAALREGEAYEKDRAWQKAVAAYDRLAAKWPTSPHRVRGCYRAGFCRARVSAKNPYDERALNAAIETLRHALRLDPADPEAAEATRVVAELSARASRLGWERAEFYDRIRHDDRAARLAYAEFLRAFPTAPEAARVRERLAELGPEPEPAPAPTEAR